ncbi:unnamed protein product [Aspergillus niger]|nr:unnamed protein product [Aspergillus niger]
MGVRDAPQGISRILDEVASVGGIAQQLVKTFELNDASSLPSLHAMDGDDGALRRSTGDWLLNTAQYLKWKTNPNIFLWIKGAAGCGKTVLWYVSSLSNQVYECLCAHVELMR